MGLTDWAKRTSHRLRRDAHMLWIAARDPRTPLLAKLIGGFVAAYALSPIDLIPDFVPLLGLLDELIIVPLGLLAAVALIPDPLLDEFRAKADNAVERPISRAGAAMIILLWTMIAVFVALQLWALRYW
ncbi:YkvA family protein [Sandaracinobacteroides hominis]|uniref:YkvA family protein n=1 Tax=Sandaracinobacteroides hominis TaxID=2780086 RepID=UPI0018F54ECA|nr:DUF1232 domain-containing protein [Sandaracinobacteroides hominis]